MLNYVVEQAQGKSGQDPAYLTRSGKHTTTLRVETAINTLHTHDYPSYVPVIIVGAGPTGLTAGNLLGMAGIETLILERNVDLSDCPKAISIDDEGLRTCQAIGLEQEVIKHVLLDINAQYVSGGHLLASIAPTERRNGHPLISTFHQPAFEAILLRGLTRFPCARLLFQHTVVAFEQVETHVQLTIHTSTGTSISIACNYLLACDGGRSPTRHALGIPMLPADFHWRSLLPGKRSARQHEREQIQRWLVVDCLNDDDPSTVATFFCDFGRQAVTVPAPHRGRRWEFLLLPGEQAEEMLHQERVHQLIQQARRSLPSHNTSRSAPAPPQVIRQTVYTFRNAIAAHFHSGRIFLLGDAAHLMPPFGGQGMNSGLRDALNLCWKIQLVEQGLARPSLLESYHQERYPQVARMIRFSSILGNLIMPPSRSLTRIRDLFFRSANLLPIARHILTEARPKPQPAYQQGLLLSGNARHSRTLSGNLLPQPYVMTLAGTRLLLDDVLGSGFALLHLSDQGATAFSPIKGPLWEQLGTRFVCIHPGNTRPLHNNTPERCTTVIDCDQQLTTFLRHHHTHFVLVRPDRYIMGTFTVANTDRFTSDLQHILQHR